MNPLTITALIVLAVATTANYFFGSRKNKALAGTYSRFFEEILKPRNTNYVNIGGVIGYNFTYALEAPFTSAKGTMALSPRHSLLYFPVSLLLGMRDRVFINVFTKKKLRGEVHVIETRYIHKAKIDGLDDMEYRETVKAGKKFTIMWRGADLSAEAEKVLDAMPDPKTLRHFSVYPGTKTFFLHLNPSVHSMRGMVEAFRQRLPMFIEKGKGKDEAQDGDEE